MEGRGGPHFHTQICTGIATTGSKGESVTVIDRVIVFAEDYSVVAGTVSAGSPLRCVSCFVNSNQSIRKG